jgi:tritrans,polycis-undecaprenyl-diphosphate synthase [geranylgeranyl-diphosphate specific]
MLQRVRGGAVDLARSTRGQAAAAASRLRAPVETAYQRHLLAQISGAPEHVAIIQDGNRRYARRQGDEATDGHREGAETTAHVLEWCEEVGVEELTLYAFSTENFERPPEEREAIFDLVAEKLREFADVDEVHDEEVCIRAIGDIDRLPERVQDAVDYAEDRTREYDRFHLNVALAYGGRHELLEAARSVAADVACGDLDPGDVCATEVECRLYERPERAVDLIIRTGGDERTSNFLPWYANGNEAAAFFCTPYWPEFSKTDFLRAVRTYEHREASFRRDRARRALALLRSLGEVELEEAREVVSRFRDHLPSSDAGEAGDAVERDDPVDHPEPADGETAD